MVEQSRKRRISMFCRVLFIFLALMPIATTVEGGLWDTLKGYLGRKHYTPPPMIDVLIVNDQSSVILEVKGKYHLYDPNTNKHLSSRMLGKRKPFETMASGLKWGEEFPGTYQIKIVPDGHQTTVVIDGEEYYGAIVVYDIGGSISIVNRVDIEDYLSSMLPQQFPEALPEETLAAVAITARTNAYYDSLNPRNPFWAVDAQKIGYKGINSAHYHNEMERAIRATSHMVMSKTGTYEGVITPFAAQWGTLSGRRISGNDAIYSKISLYEAEEMGKKEIHAAQILNKAFTGSHIELIH